jgi:hypothetical protein
MIGQYMNSHKTTTNGKVASSTAYLQNGQDKIEVSLEVISASKAAEYLANSAGNRPLKKTNLSLMSKAMSANEWHITGQPIIFNEQGVLIDGHHRLTACVKSGVDFRSLVVRNIRREALSSIDVGGKRTIGDQLTFIDKSAYVSPNIIATVYKRIYCYVNQLAHINLSDQQVVNYIEQTNGSWCDTALYTTANKNSLNGSAISAAAFILKDANAINVDLFMHKLVTGEMIAVHDPIHTLRTRMLMDRRIHLHQYNWVISSIIRAYNCWIANKKMDRIHLFTQSYTEPKF